MLVMRVDVLNEAILLERLTRAPIGVLGAMSRTMDRAGKGVFYEAMTWLSGSKGSTGGFPVPVVTGHLRRMLAWLKPGETKSSEGQVVTAGPAESVVYDTARYSTVIALGLGSSAKFGPRDYLRRALDDFNVGGRIERILYEELRNVLDA